MGDLYQPPDTQLTDQAAPAEYAGFWLRVAAALIDAIGLTLVTMPLSLAVFGWDVLLAPPDQLGTTNLLINYLLPALLVLGFWWVKLATPGKLLVGIRIVDAETGGRPSIGQLLGRYFGYLVAMLPLFLGFAWVAWDRRKQGFHDKLAGTVVVSAAGPVADLEAAVPAAQRLYQTLAPLVLGACVMGLGVLGLRLVDGLGAPDLENARDFEHGGVRLRYPGNWEVLGERSESDWRVLQLMTPGGTHVLFLVTRDASHLEGYGASVLDHLAAGTSEAATIGDVEVTSMEREPARVQRAEIDGRMVEGVEWRYTLRVLGVGDPGHAGYFAVEGRPLSLGIVYHGSLQDAAHFEKGFRYVLDTVRVPRA